MAGKYFYKGVDLYDLIESGYSGNIFAVTAQTNLENYQKCSNFGYYNNSVAISDGCQAKRDRNSGSNYRELRIYDLAFNAYIIRLVAQGGGGGKGGEPDDDPRGGGGGGGEAGGVYTSELIMQSAGSNMCGILSLQRSGQDENVTPDGGLDGKDAYFYKCNFDFLYDINLRPSLKLFLDANNTINNIYNKIQDWLHYIDRTGDASQPVSTIRPIIDYTHINSSPAIFFGSVPGSLLITNTEVHTTRELTLFFVMKPQSSSGLQQFLSTRGGWTNGAIHLQFYNNYLSWAVSPLQAVSSPYSPTMNSPLILMMSFKSMEGQFQISYKYNGNTASTVTSNGVSIINMLSYFEIGGWSGDNTRTFKGGISEIIQYNKILTGSQIIEIEGYLATKWRLRNILSSSHSFYSSSTVNDTFFVALGGARGENGGRYIGGNGGSGRSNGGNGSEGGIPSGGAGGSNGTIYGIGGRGGDGGNLLATPRTGSIGSGGGNLFAEIVYKLV